MKIKELFEMAVGSGAVGAGDVAGTRSSLFGGMVKRDVPSNIPVVKKAKSKKKRFVLTKIK